jgi:hypothetical protein
MAGIVPFQSYIVNRDYWKNVWNQNNYTNDNACPVTANSPDMNIMPGFLASVHPFALDVFVFV